MKKSLLVIHKMLSLFFHTYTVDEKHYLLIRDNLTQTIQIQLYQEQKTFCEFFVTFLKAIFNFKHFPKKAALIADVFLKILAPKNMLR